MNESDQFHSEELNKVCFRSCKVLMDVFLPEPTYLLHLDSRHLRSRLISAVLLPRPPFPSPPLLASLSRTLLLAPRLLESAGGPKQNVNNRTVPFGPPPVLYAYFSPPNYEDVT